MIILMSNIYWQVHFKRENNSRITRKHSLTLWKEASPHYEVLCEILLAVCFSFSMGIPHSLSPVILSFVHCLWFIACLWINNRQILPYSHQVNMASTPPQPSFLSISTIAVLTSDTHLGLVRLLGKYCYVFRKSSVYELCLIVIWSNGFHSVLFEALLLFWPCFGSKEKATELAGFWVSFPSPSTRSSPLLSN